MDQDEDYKELFFTECDELLGQLQDHLTELAGGTQDRSILDAAFRAVHSVKGGAAAFGMDQLTSFAHGFEAVMDACRSGQLNVDDETIPVLTRASDMMLELVESSRSGAPVRTETLAQTSAALAGFLGGQVDEPAAPPPAAAPAMPEDGDSVIIRFAPRPDFIYAGHDPLRMLRAAQGIGLTSVAISGDLQPLTDLDPLLMPWEWQLTFTDADPTALRDFFSIYDLSVDVQGLPTIEAAPALRTVNQSGTVASPPASLSSYTKSLRVPLDRIDRLVNLVGEIVITQAAVAQEMSLIRQENDETLDHSIDALSRQVREMQDSVMAIRAQPIKSVFSRMPRIVRDLCETLNREVRIEVSGEETEVDTSVIEELVEPLTHMIRNAMDHGIEAPDDRAALGKPRNGLLRLTAQHRGERVLITLEDNGRGIDRDKVVGVALQRGLITSAEGLSAEDIDNLIFLPGFSTASTVSSVSGRGVGMDVVKRKIQALGGRCLIHSAPGEGTRFQVTLPLTLAVLEGMIVEVSGERYVIPLSAVIEAMQLRDTTVERLHNGQLMVARRGEYLPVYALDELFGGPSLAPAATHKMALVVDTETNGHIGLLVDALIGQRQVVLKGLEANFRPITGISGATILGDGRVALIVDVPSLVERQKRAKSPQFNSGQEVAPCKV
ncbi:two-component system, chemotaxis family, sensor kinase CheA [Monaibacterium marinum]|uniref:Chemotaxis protein CheA n=1 Tax=Pontivivens marinum TaxID=1690039 RepID=A0A2C9CMY6_9RHOB|nr:chemotaxis protein CheA [Monaibacterium marinum]SOH92756.1 two-component system, chemotaxis family, sensor kinase CheA [Monaibacterium marinum]